jgi:deoxyribonuclease-4
LASPLVGVHVSITGSLELSVERALSIGCSVFQIFTRNPQGWKFSRLTEETADRFRKALDASGIKLVVSHMPYLPNLASPDPIVYSKSLEALEEELRRAERLGLGYVVAHLGSHMGRGLIFGQERLAKAISSAYDSTRSKTRLLLENMAGQKNSVGASFSDIARIIELSGIARRLGVCFDTCHAYAAGYDLGTPGAVERTLSEFDEQVGIEKLRLLHLNDSKGQLGCRLDRHENIGKGFIGRDGFKAILADKRVRSLPLILETPVAKAEDYVRDMSLVKRLYSATS